MLDIANYHLLVLRGFDALKREIQEAEQYTVSQYNSIIKQQNAVNEANQTAQPQSTSTTKPTAKKKEN